MEMRFSALSGVLALGLMLSVSVAKADDKKSGFDQAVASLAASTVGNGPTGSSPASSRSAASSLAIA